jgi:hypothetical protein
MATSDIWEVGMKDQERESYLRWQDIAPPKAHLVGSFNAYSAASKNAWKPSSG